MLYLAFIAIVAVVALFILPSNKKPEGCICKWGFMGPLVQDDCPVHKGWAEPLYPVEEIEAANLKAKSEREKACIKHGIEYNKILKDKWDRK